MGDEWGDESDDKTDAFSLQQRNTAYNAPVRVGLGFLTASQPDAAKGLAVERQSSLFRFPGKNARYLLLPYVPYDCNITPHSQVNFFNWSGWPSACYRMAWSVVEKILPFLVLLPD